MFTFRSHEGPPNRNTKKNGQCSVAPSRSAAPTYFVKFAEEVKQDIGALKQDISALKQDVGALRREVKEDIASLSRRIDSFQLVTEASASWSKGFQVWGVVFATASLAMVADNYRRDRDNNSRDRLMDARWAEVSGTACDAKASSTSALQLLSGFMSRSVSTAAKTRPFSEVIVTDGRSTFRVMPQHADVMGLKKAIKAERQNALQHIDADHIVVKLQPGDAALGDREALRADSEYYFEAPAAK